MGELLEMSHKELDRYQILKRVQDKEMTQNRAGSLLGITSRQVRNLLVELRIHGPVGLIDRRRGQLGNHRLNEELKQKVLARVREKYEGFAPTLAQEKLEERDNLKISVETLRQWMIEAGLWHPKSKGRRRHPSRLRRAMFGEVIQGDGSPHYWFGEDEPMANVTVFVDDATSRLTALVFSETETLDSYFQALEQHLKRYGRPRALYTDRASMFDRRSDKSTHMQRALNSLNIELILANSPQAKGRVERANRTLQDRLTKEMRLRGIKTIEEANAFAEEFLEMYNNKFSKEPMSSIDAHRPLDGYDLERILCRYEVRTLLSTGTLQYKNLHYQVQDVSDYRRLTGRKVEIRERNGQLRAFINDKEHSLIGLTGVRDGPSIMNRKEVLVWKTRENRKVSVHHPYKRGLSLDVTKRRMMGLSDM